MPSINLKYLPISSSPSSPTSSYPPSYSSSLASTFRSARILFYVCTIQTVVILFAFSAWVRSGGAGSNDVGCLATGGQLQEESWCRGEFGTRVCEIYGAHNVKLSRLYEGTSTRLRHVFHRARSRNTPLRMAALGGSVTKGHGLGSKDDIWLKHVSQNLSPVHKNIFTNGAMPAVGSGYFAACFSSHLPSDEVDIVFVELSINDLYREEDARSFEELVRGLLELPNQPAVVVVQTVGLNAELLAVGGDLHLPVAAFYDIPTISLRPLVLPELMSGSVGFDYFDMDGWGNPDYRHINERSHAALADLVSSFLLEQWDRSSSPSYTAPLDLPNLLPSTSDTSPSSRTSASPLSFWPGAERLMNVPKTLFFQKFDPSTLLEPLAPVCYTASQGEYAESIFPLLSSNQNWTFLTPAATPDKTYLSASYPSSSFSIPVPVASLGKAQIYYLRAGGSTEEYGLGSIECWIGDDWASRKRFDGWWDDWRPHIGQFGIVATGLSPGTHQLSCRLMEETRDPGGGTNFRIISIAGI